jgi:hypothetical protein
MEYCKNTNIPVGTKVKVINNFCNSCEPFVGMTGTATHPFRFGCCSKGWIGVILDQENIYRKNHNFHTDELEILLK